MARCANCGTTILFGGKKIDDLKFCNDKCMSDGQVLMLASQVPADVVATQARAIHAGNCPVCRQSRGPVDVHTSHKVASFLIMSSWSSTPRVSCNSCGTRAQLGALVYSLLLGWWGIPWGLVMTPVQVVKNIAAMLRSEDSLAPSEQLEHLVRMGIASQAFDASRQGARQFGT